MSINKKIIGIEIDHSVQSKEHHFFWSDLRLKEELQGIQTQDEVFVLSTCNRWTLFAYTSDTRFFVEYVKNKFPNLTHNLLEESEDAVCHLFEVAGGLKSRSIGEHEILGQLRNALALNNAAKKMGPVLNEFVRYAIKAGKKVRTESSIGAHYTSYSSITLNLIQKKFGKDDPLDILVIGTGKISRMILKISSKLVLDQAFLASHSDDRAGAVAAEYGYHAVNTQNIADIIPLVDVIIGCTHRKLDFSAEDLDLSAQDLSKKLFIDFGVPGNFPDWLHDIPSTEIFAIKEIQAINDQNVNKRKKEIPKVKQLIKNEIGIFLKSHQERKISPLLKSLQESVDRKRDQQLKWLLNRLDDLNERELKIIEKFSHRISSEFTRSQFQVMRELSADLEHNLPKLELIQSLNPK